MRSDFGQFIIHPIVNFFYIFFRIIPSGHPALVGDKDGQIAVVVDVFNGLLGAFYPDEVFRTMKVGYVYIECAVTIEKNGFIFSRCSQSNHLC